MPSICLNMIVKNEAPVIERCLASVRPWIDHWVIVDTGSTDGTQDMVREAMAGVPGTLHERPWKNFGHNRNEALQLARSSASQLLFIDADERLELPSAFSWPTMFSDGSMFRCTMNGWEYHRNSMVATRLPWRWEGVLHEYLACDAPHRWETVEGPRIVVSHDGARARDPSTYLKDIALMTEALTAEPGHTRYRFYLAQSFRDAGLLAQSLDAYRARAALGGWEEERWFSLFQIAMLLERLNAPTQEVREAFLAAYAARPARAEPLCELARHLRLRGEFALAHVYALRAAAMDVPPDLLFVDAGVYRWRALDELATSAYYVGALHDGKAALHKLLSEDRAPQHERVRLIENLSFYGG